MPLLAKICFDTSEKEPPKKLSTRVLFFRAEPSRAEYSVHRAGSPRVPCKPASLAAHLGMRSIFMNALRHCEMQIEIRDCRPSRVEDKEVEQEVHRSTTWRV